MSIKKSSIIGMVIAFILVPILAIVGFNMLFSSPSDDETDTENDPQMTNHSEENVLTDYEASVYDTLNADNCVFRNILVKSPFTAAPTIWGVGTRMDVRIQILLVNTPHCDCAECESSDFLSKLHEYLVELVLQGDIQDHVLDFTCELCSGSELSVRTIDHLFPGVEFRTGNTRQVNNVMQREMRETRRASIYCSECSTMMVSVFWEEMWWEDSHINIENKPLGIILEDNTPVFETNIDTEPMNHLVGLHQGAVVAPISECYNGKVFVYVTSVGGWDLHNGWNTWSLWIPCGSFELMRTELLSDEMRFCTSE